MPHPLRPLLSILIPGLALLGCGPTTPPKEATFTNLQPILTRSCALSASCHQTASPSLGNLNLSVGKAYCSLLGQTGGATYRDMAKGDFPRRVEAGNRDRSFLYKKLVLTDAETGSTKPLGQRMPLGAMLDADETDLFGRWIDAGAKDDSPSPAGCN